MMETLHYSIGINTDKQKVWDTMLAGKTYREWTKAFQEGSYYEGSWEKGSEIRFLGPDKDLKLQGMYSRIKENIPYEFLSIEHLGLIKDGEIDTASEEVKQWAPAFENYTFTEKDGKTELNVDMQADPKHKAMFDDMWPKALKALKEACER